MLDKEYYNKIDEIIAKFLENNSTKCWELGTNFYSSLKKFIKKINENKLISDISHNKLFIEQDYLRINNNFGKERFYIKLLNKNNNLNVTPTIKSSRAAAKSTIRQYLQVWFSLDLIKTLDDKDELIIEDGSYFIVTNKILDFIKYDDKEILWKFVKLICESINTNTKYKRNLGFTLFLSLIDEYGQQNNTNCFMSLNNFTICPNKKSGKLKQYPDLDIGKNLTTTIEYIRHVKGEDTKFFGKGKNTYTRLCGEILENYDFKEIIDSIYDYAIGEDNVFSLTKKTEKEVYKEVRKYSLSLKQERGKLRKNIREQRFDCYHDKDNYFDITNSPTNSNDISYLDACHIYSVENIIKDFEKEINDKTPIGKIINKELADDLYEKYSDFITNYNNGILLSKTCHKMYDDNLVWFTEDGKLNYLKEEENNVEKHFGCQYKDVRIADHVLNKQMQEFIRKRNNINKLDNN